MSVVPPADASREPTESAAGFRDAIRFWELAEARDGYRVLFSLAELAPSLGNQRVLLVDRVDGEALSAEDGPWRLVMPGEAHPTRWARQVVTLRVAAAP